MSPKVTLKKTGFVYCFYTIFSRFCPFFTIRTEAVMFAVD